MTIKRYIADNSNSIAIFAGNNQGTISYKSNIKVYELKISNNNDDNNENHPINETHQNKDGFFKIKNTWGCCFRWLGLISIVFLIINLFLLLIGSFDYSEDNLNALLFYGLFAAIFIIVYFGRFMSFLRGKCENKSNKMPLTDIDEKTKNDSIERTREMLTKIINQNDSK